MFGRSPDPAVTRNKCKVKELINDFRYFFTILLILETLNAITTEIGKSFQIFANTECHC